MRGEVREEGSGISIQGLGFRGLGFRGLGFRVQEFRFRVLGAYDRKSRRFNVACMTSPSNSDPQRAQHPLNN